MAIFSSRNREFPCPHCRKPVVVVNGSNGAATLRHPLNGCKAPAKDLLAAYVLACKPTMKYPKFETVADALWEKHEKELKDG